MFIYNNYPSNFSIVHLCFKGIILLIMGEAGKPRGLKNPEQMLSWFIEYRDYTKANPRYKIEYVGKEGQRVKTPLETPLTIEGFKCFCYDKGVDPNRCWYKVDDALPDYVRIVTRIKQFIREDQIGGGMVGQYNSNLTARMNNIKEQTETINTTNIKLMNIDPLADTEE